MAIPLPSTSSDYAAWVQAIGSILAILAAIFIASAQSRADQQRRERERLERQTWLRQTLSGYGLSLLSNLARARRACATADRQSLEELAKNLEDMSMFLASLEPTLIPSNCILGVLALRRITNNAAGAASKFSELNYIALALEQPFFRKLYDEAKFSYEGLARHLELEPLDAHDIDAAGK
jgi:hypothetical protein